MTSDRWEQINRLWDMALELSVEDRPAFLERNCQGDEDLRREVESLLAYDQQAQQLLDRPALQLTAEKLAAEPPSLVGQQLGPYQILGVLGAGGMGEVFTARDTRLNRTVAIKVLPRLLSERAELRQRFEREARAIASLSHPNICALHDIGRQDGIDFLVMEYLEGETLSQRLRRGPLPTADVLSYSIEIAGALRAAHRKGVTHRDVKPGNIMLTEAGAKLLDFGLAKHQALSPLARGTIGGQDAGEPGVGTETKSLTEEGTILGTLEYMAPEQLEGKEADARTDIFALGVVIYEMATGRKAFEADSKASLIAKILTFQPPPMTTIQPVSPPELDSVVQRCLLKKPEERWQSAEELAFQLQEIAETVLPRRRTRKSEKQPSTEAKEIEPNARPTGPVAMAEPPKVLSKRIRSRAWQLGFVGALLAVITGSIALWRVRQQPQKPVENKAMSFKALTSQAWDNPVDCAGISPDGTYLAYCSKGKLYVQVIRTGEKRSLPLPEGFYSTRVGWFPDGTKLFLGRSQERWIRVKEQLTWQSDLSIWSISILGGKPQLIVDHADYASVSPDGSLVAIDRVDPDRQARDIWLVGANGEGLHKLKIASQAGRPDPATGGPSYGGAVWSPNGQRILYYRTDDHGPSSGSCDLRGEQIISFSSLETSVCVPHWSTDGRIIQLLQKKEAGLSETNVNLWETKVDAAGRPLSEARRLTQWSGGFSFSTAGFLSMTADGRRAVVLKRQAQGDIYVAEAEPGGKSMKNPQRLTLDETDDSMSDWTADSRAVLFVSYRNGNGDIFKQDIGQKDGEVVVTSPEDEWHPNLSPDRAFILYLVSEKRGEPAKRLMRIPVGGGPPEQVLSGEKIKNFSCAREANLCVVVEEVEGKQVLTRFDPLKGRGEKLPMSDYPEARSSILSLQGRLIESMKSGPNGLSVRVRSLTGGPVEEITWKKLTREYHLYDWSPDGKGINVFDWPGLDSEFTALYLGLDGSSHVFWNRGTSAGWSFDGPIFSPDGRHLAYTVVTYESNAWMLENF